MTASLKRARTRAAVTQGHRCFYCGLPVWDRDPDTFASEHLITKRQAALLRCTAEHLIARSDGGTNARMNVVAACAYCNSHRHRACRPLDPVAYRERVSARMKRGRWLAGVVPQLSGARS
jgi:hypothetical protein